MSELPPLPDVPVGRYRHYKGQLYDLIGVVRHSETLELLALYRPLVGDNTLWVRPWAMFFETVVINGVKQARFARVAGVAGVAGVVQLVETPKTGAVPAQPPAISS
ncbi:MAG: DUF1653 domain-containing protein [Microbacteriaceae bacterium]|nr:DUF1653 domain-containing protein [Burkholderiaceae bacterium]